MLTVQLLVGGLIVLFALAVVIGVSDGRAQARGWKRLAAARHELWLDRQDAAASSPPVRCGCPDCLGH